MFSCSFGVLDGLQWSNKLSRTISFICTWSDMVRLLNEGLQFIVLGQSNKQHVGCLRLKRRWEIFYSVCVQRWALEELSVSHNLFHIKYILATHPHTVIYTRRPCGNWFIVCLHLHRNQVIQRNQIEARYPSVYMSCDNLFTVKAVFICSWSIMELILHDTFLTIAIIVKN